MMMVVVLAVLALMPYRLKCRDARSTDVSGWLFIHVHASEVIGMRAKDRFFSRGFTMVPTPMMVIVIRLRNNGMVGLIVCTFNQNPFPSNLPC